jgi:hypothetical protein
VNTHSLTPTQATRRVHPRDLRRIARTHGFVVTGEPGNLSQEFLALEVRDEVERFLKTFRRKTTGGIVPIAYLRAWLAARNVEEQLRRPWSRDDKVAWRCADEAICDVLNGSGVGLTLYRLPKQMKNLLAIP